MPNECSMMIGNVYFSIVFSDPFYAKVFRMYYDGFLFDKGVPDLFIELDVIHHRTDDYKVDGSLLMSKVVDGNHFKFGELLEGILDLPAKYCKMSVKKVLLENEGARLFERILCQIYWAVLRNRILQEASFFIHASGIVCDNKGFVFSGPSGSGKSTIASLSKHGIVLNDDCVMVQERKDGFWVRGTPFSGKYKVRNNIESCLRAVFLIEHSKDNVLEPLRQSDFIIKFIRELMPSYSIFSMDNKKVFSEMLDFCHRLAQKVPVYKLGFYPDIAFWECIKKEGLL